MDFSSVKAYITLSPNHRSSLVSMKIIDDSIPEANETFTVHLTSFSPNAFTDTPNATVTIVDDDDSEI